MPPIFASQVRYIKLGTRGMWEKDCIKQKIIRFGYDTGTQKRFSLCKRGEWDKLQESLETSGIGRGEATNIKNQAQYFFEDDGSTLWITFVGDKLYWGFMEPQSAKRSKIGTSVDCKIKNGWKCNDLKKNPLTRDRLSGALTQITGFRGTSCKVNDKAAEYVKRRIGGEESMEVEHAKKAIEELNTAMLAMIQSLYWGDFEILVDLIFSTSGWRREGTLGKTQQTIDFDIFLPSTGEKAFVQVKSNTTTAQLQEYISRLDGYNTYDRMFYVYHSGEAATNDKRVTVIGPQKLAAMATDAGLVNWLMRKHA